MVGLPLRCDPPPADDAVDKRFQVLCGDDGWLSYEIKDVGGSPARRQARGLRPIAATPEAYAALWHYCVSLDWIATVESGDRPVAEPLGELLTDPRRAVVSDINDFVWARLLDVPATLSARTYSGRDALVLESSTRSRRPAAASASPPTAGDEACVPHEAPDLTITARDLGAAWLGGSGLWMAADAGRVSEHTAGAVGRFDNLFVTDPPPWCNTWF